MPVALPLAELGDLDLRISTGRVVIGSLQIGDAAASASIKDGKLAIEIGEASFHDGQIQASLSAEMRGPELAASAEAEIDGVPARAALIDLAGIDALDGLGTVSLDLSTAGRSWSELARGLAGTARLSVADGSFADANLVRFGALLGNPAGFSMSGVTAFRSLTGALTIGDGAVSIDELRAEGDGFELGLSGRASLVDASLSRKRDARRAGPGRRRRDRAAGGALPPRRHLAEAGACFPT